MSSPVSLQDQQPKEVSDAPQGSPSWLKWLCRILGVLILLGVVAVLPSQIFRTAFVVKVFQKGSDQALEGALAGLVGSYVGIFVMAWVGIRLLRGKRKRKSVQKTPGEAVRTETVVPVQPAVRASGKKTQWSLCNVLSVATDTDTRQLWQFDARSEAFNLGRVLTARNGDALPPNIVAKSWGALFKSKLNVAWLPAEYVFLRVAQFPASTPEELRSMVELQLEKLSPIPVTQALWTMHVLPQAAPAGEAATLQTVVVIVVARDVVEEFLGKLEGQGYMADRLELPMLDQLRATRVAGDGAWLYPEGSGLDKRALVAWWYGGVLQNLALLSLDAGPNRIASLKDQLVQMTWAGELDGWLTSAPHWHLVGDQNNPWFDVLREALEQPVEVVPPVPVLELAAMTAKRAARSESTNNLLPPEFAVRYQQQFVDRLWGRGLLAALAVYAVCLAIYFVALTVFSHVTSGVQARAADLSLTYTNSIQMKEMLGVLKQRETLKFAALDCWKAVAETMPTGLTLDTLNFNDGKTMSLRGTAPTDQVSAVTDFWDTLRKWKNGTQPMFESAGAEPPHTAVNPGGSTVNWSFELELKQSEK
jgi:hypothetical protein